MEKPVKLLYSMGTSIYRVTKQLLQGSTAKENLPGCGTDGAQQQRNTLTVLDGQTVYPEFVKKIGNSYQ